LLIKDSAFELKVRTYFAYLLPFRGWKKGGKRVEKKLIVTD
jgi:hypothetical protein